jgi:hypothetical protein
MQRTQRRPFLCLLPPLSSIPTLPQGYETMANSENSKKVFFNRFIFSGMAKQEVHFGGGNGLVVALSDEELAHGVVLLLGDEGDNPVAVFKDRGVDRRQHVGPS